MAQAAVKEITAEETVVAIIPQQAKGHLVELDGEVELNESVTAIESEAIAITIESDADFNDAAEFGRRVKRALAEVKGFFKPMKDSAYAAHRAICNRENEMLKPLTNAEKTLKKTMGEYAAAKERERQRIEAEARRLAKEEADRKLAEAIKQEEAGNAEASSSAFVDATMADNMSRNLTTHVAPPKAEGISQTKGWEIVEVDSEKVPTHISGMEVRPVDQAAVMRIIKASKGTVKIPGITYKEVINTAIWR